MLVLSRKVDESICIGEGIIIRVIGVFAGRVKLGISAPNEVRILRSELMPTQSASRQSDAQELSAIAALGELQVAT